MAQQIAKKREQSCSQPAKTDREVLLGKQRDEERRFQDALEDDEVREELKLSYERDKERMRKKREENDSQSAKTFRNAILVNGQERRFQDALEDDEIREELKFSYARDKQRLACDRR